MIVVKEESLKTFLRDFIVHCTVSLASSTHTKTQCIHEHRHSFALVQTITIIWSPRLSRIATSLNSPPVPHTIDA